MKNFIVNLCGAVLSAVYWWLVATVGFTLANGDVDPTGPPPSESAMMTTSSIVIAIAILVYAGASMIWRRMETRFLKRSGS